MRLCRYCWVACLALLLLFRGEAYAAAVPAYTGKMNTAVGGVISHKVGKWGFAANDPRFGATMTGVGAGVTTLVVGGLGVAVGAATWPAVLVGAGITALVSGAVAWGQDSLLKWVFNPDGTITTQGNTSTVPNPNGVYQPSSGASCSITQVYNWCGGPDFQACMPAGAYNPTLSCSPNWASYGFSAHATDMSSAMQIAGYITPTTTTGSEQVNVSPAAAVAAMPDAELVKPVSNELLAAAANAAWKAMAANAPNALPWSATDPITPADVAEWKAANPSAVPNVGDAIAPVASPGSSAVPIAQPGATPSTGPAATPGQGTQVDLGPNPNIGAPGLEATPTAQMIMNPILNLFPDLKNFAVPAHTGECPKGSFAALGRDYTMDSQCQLIESNRSIIEAAMLLVWAIASIFIVLRA